MTSKDATNPAGLGSSNENQRKVKVGKLIDIEESESEPEIEAKSNSSYFENDKVILLVIPPQANDNSTTKGNNGRAASPVRIMDIMDHMLDKTPHPLTSVDLKNRNKSPVTELANNMGASTKPDIVIGEIDKDEASILYKNLLEIGKRAVEWLSTNCNSNICSDFTFSNPPEAHAIHNEIVSIETEYNRLKRAIKLGCTDTNETSPQTFCYKYKAEELIKPEDIQPRIFSSSCNDGKDKDRKAFRQEDQIPCSSTCKPKTVVPASCQCRNSKVAKTCSFCLEDRLKNLAVAIGNHEGNFTNVVAELKACLEYCNSFSGTSTDELRIRISALFKIVQLHKAAIEDWKKELQNKCKSYNTKNF